MVPILKEKMVKSVAPTQIKVFVLPRWLIIEFSFPADESSEHKRQQKFGQIVRHHRTLKVYALESVSDMRKRIISSEAKKTCRSR